VRGAIDGVLSPGALLRAGLYSPFRAVIQENSSICQINV
jgi:hypothetical protein